MIDHSLLFFDLAYQNFLGSLCRMSEVKKFYRLSHFTLCLQFAGEALVDFLTPALQHLEIDPPEKSDFTICIWDSISTHTPPMKLPWKEDAYAVRGNVIGYNNERVHTVFDSQMKILQVFDRERSLALYWIEDLNRAPWWIGASPLLFILHWWMSARGHQVTHAAAVGHPEGGVLLAGKGGAGKSTTSLSCMKAGMKYVSEDYCLLSEAPNIRAYSLYNSAKIGDKTLSFFPALGQYIENRDRPKEDKALFFHYKFQPENILASFPLKALITLKIVEARDSYLEPIGPYEAVASLSASTLWQLSHAGPAVFNHLKKVAQSLPCYVLHLGSDLAQSPQLIGKLL